jgi:hypothetical protein
MDNSPKQSSQINTDLSVENQNIMLKRSQQQQKQRAKYVNLAAVPDNHRSVRQKFFPHYANKKITDEIFVVAKTSITANSCNPIFAEMGVESSIELDNEMHSGMTGEYVNS